MRRVRRVIQRRQLRQAVITRSKRLHINILQTRSAVAWYFTYDVVDFYERFYLAGG